jgi:hypothetical protein
MGRKLALVALAVFLGGCVVVACGYFIFKGRIYTIYFEREQIQRAIDSRLPYTKKFAPGLEVTFRDSKIHLMEGSDRFGASTALTLNYSNPDPMTPPLASISSEGGLRYDPDSATFYLVEPRIIQVRMQGLSRAQAGFVSTGATTLLQKFYAEIPVYTIQDRTLKATLLTATLRRVEVINGRVVISLGY